MLVFACHKFGPITSLMLRTNKPISLIYGTNESGKTTLTRAFEVALSGQIDGLKGQELQCYNQHINGAYQIDLHIDKPPLDITRSLGKGTPLKTIAASLGVPVEVLPLLASPRMCGDGGSKAMKVFLETITQAKFDPLEYFQEDPVILRCVHAAQQAKVVLPDRMIPYFTTQRAACKVPTKPGIPSAFKVTPDDIEQRRKDLQQKEVEKNSAGVFARQVRELRDNLTALDTFLAQMAAYEKLRSETSLEDPLAGKRKAYQNVLEANLDTLDAWKSVLREAGKTAMADTLGVLVEQIQKIRTELRGILDKNPPPSRLPPAPVFPAQAAALKADLENRGSYTAAGIAAFLNDATAKEKEATEAVSRTTQRYNEAKAGLESALSIKGAWDHYETMSSGWEADAEKAKAEWDAWDRAAKMMEEAMLHHTRTTEKQFSELVGTVGKTILQGRQIYFTRNAGIQLDRDPISQCSASAKWRVEIAIMVAIGRMLHSPILVVDAMDILDDENQRLFLDFLVGEVAPHFAHAVITSTPSGALRPADPGLPITNWLLTEGCLYPISQNT